MPKKLLPVEKAEQGLPLTQKEIEAFRKTFHNYPSPMYQSVTDDGEGVLCLATFKNHICGCRITGNGSIPFPLTIKFCTAHAAIKI